MGVFVKCLCKIEKVDCYAKITRTFRHTDVNALMKIWNFIIRLMLDFVIKINFKFKLGL